MAKPMASTKAAPGARALQKAKERRARKVHFYTNGKPYLSRLTVSLQPGRDFQTLELFCQFLTLKSQVLNGVKYIFSLNGRSINELEELEHDQSYVMSGSKHFITYTYGHNFAPIYGRVSDRARYLAKQEELRLLRPLSSKYNNVYAEINRLTPEPLNKIENRVITVINNRDHSLQAKVIVNLKSPKSFDLVLRDLAQAVRLRFPKRMFTSSGQEVKCVSQLKYELDDVDVFYIDSQSFDDQLRLLSHLDDDLSSRRFCHSMESLPTFNDDHTLMKYYQQAAYCSSNLDLSPARRVEADQATTHNENVWLTSPQSSKPVKVETLKSSQKTFASQQKAGEEVNTPQSIVPPSPVSIPQTTLPHTTKTIQKSASTSNIAGRKHNDRKRKSEKLENTLDQQNKQAISLFSLENISAEKYEQIQKYAEKMVQEASSQVPTEVVARKRRSMSKRTPERIASSGKAVVPSETKTMNIPIIRTLPPSSHSNRSVKTPDEKPKEIEPEVIVAKDVAKEMAQVSSNLSPLRRKPSSRGVSKQQPKPVPKQTKSESNNSTSQKPVEPLFTKTKARPLNTKASVSTTRQADNRVKTKPGQKPKIQKKASEEEEEGDDSEEHLRHGVNVPEHFLQLQRIFGFNGKKMKNICFLNESELAFASGVFVVLWNVKTNRQRFYREHDDEILCLANEPKCVTMASCQLLSGCKASTIRIWSGKTLETISVLKDKTLNQPVIDMQFTLNNSLFVLNGSETMLNINLWSWRDKTMLANISKPLESSSEMVYGGTVHPIENDIMVTYGRQHLIVWSHRREAPIEYRTALPLDSQLSKSISCADFLNDNSLLTGDTEGKLTIWAPFELAMRLEFAIKEIQGHEAGITCLKLTSDNILISADQDGTIKTWDVHANEFRLLNALKLPSFSGSITSLAFPAELASNFDIYVGTSENFILKGSALTTSSYTVLLEGHSSAIRTTSYDCRTDEIFYTASLDQKVCKWHVTSGLVWRRSLETQGVSSALHPSGQIIAIGAVNGLVSIIETGAGETLQHLEISNLCIGCIAYSAEGNFLAAGCQDGSIYVLPVQDEGRVYTKVSTLRGPLPVLALQWSMDTQFILTSVDDNNYQELILWDLTNTRYIRNVTKVSDNLTWYDATCSGLEEARGTWDNDQLGEVVNIATHVSNSAAFIVTGDELGVVRLFAHPCHDPQAAFFEYRQGGGSVTALKVGPLEHKLVTCSFEGSIHIWKVRSKLKKPK